MILLDDEDLCSVSRKLLNPGLQWVYGFTSSQSHHAPPFLSPVTSLPISSSPDRAEDMVTAH